MEVGTSATHPWHNSAQRLAASPLEGKKARYAADEPTVTKIGVVIAIILTTATAARSFEQASGAPYGCRSADPHAGVHHPTRLKVVRPCIEATGTVAWAQVVSDGDYKFNLKLDADDEHLLNEYNRRDRGDSLVCEIILPTSLVVPRESPSKLSSEYSSTSRNYSRDATNSGFAPAQKSRCRRLGRG